MKIEKGSPAFDNIDELLTEKIIRHTQENSDTSGTEQLQEQKSNKQFAFSSIQCKSAWRLLLIVLFLVTALTLINKTFSSRNSA